MSGRGGTTLRLSSGTQEWSEGVIAIFDAEVLSSTEIARIVLPPDELRGFRFFGLTEVGSVLPPSLARRVVAVAHARRDNTSAYLEDGYLIS